MLSGRTDFAGNGRIGSWERIGDGSMLFALAEPQNNSPKKTAFQQSVRIGQLRLTDRLWPCARGFRALQLVVLC